MASPADLLAQRLSLPDMQALPDWHAAEALNVPDVAHGTRRQTVPTATARGLLLASGEWGAIKLLSRQAVAPTDPAAPAVVLAITTIDTLELTTILEATNPAFWGAMQAMVAGLEQAKLVSARTAAALLALADAPMSWADAHGFPAGVTARDVSLARGGRA